MPFRDYALNETRYKSLQQTRPEDSEQLLAAAQAAVEEKYRTYEEMAGWSAARFHPAGLERGHDGSKHLPATRGEWEHVRVRG